MARWYDEMVIIYRNNNVYWLAQYGEARGTLYFTWSLKRPLSAFVSIQSIQSIYSQYNHRLDFNFWNGINVLGVVLSRTSLVRDATSVEKSLGEGDSLPGVSSPSIDRRRGRQVDGRRERRKLMRLGNNTSVQFLMLRRSSRYDSTLPDCLYTWVVEPLDWLNIWMKTLRSHRTEVDTQLKVKGKGRTLGIAPQVRQAYLRGAQVHGAHQAASHIPAFKPSQP